MYEARSWASRRYPERRGQLNEYLFEEDERLCMPIPRTRKVSHDTEYTRDGAETGPSELLTSQASPIPKNSKAPKTPLRIDTTAANSPSTDLHVATNTATPLTNDFKKPGSAGLRSISSLFKSRTSTDKSPVNGSVVVVGPKSPEDLREETKERKVRVAVSNLIGQN
jgi:hypothetical protein